MKDAALEDQTLGQVSFAMNLRPLRALRLATVLTTIPFAAAAASYHLIAVSAAGPAYLDGDTIEASGDHRTFWSTYFSVRDGGDDPRTAYMMTHDEVDCSGDRLRHLEGRAYDADGRPTTKYGGPTAWIVLVPGSNGAIEENLVCNAAALSGDLATTMDPLSMLRVVRSPETSPK